MNSKSLFYISNIRFPNEFAHSIQIAKMCAAFSKKIPTTLILPKRHNRKFTQTNLWQYYSIEKNSFKIKKLFCLDLVGILPNIIAHPILNFSFQISLLLFLAKHSADYIFIRDAVSFPMLSILKKIKKFKFIFELHGLPISKIEKFNLKIFSNSIDLLITLTKFTLKDFLANFKKAKKIKKTLIAPSGIDLKDFKISSSKTSLRKKLKLPQGKTIIGYAGSFKLFKGSKGVELIRSIAKSSLSNKKYIFYCLGSDLKKTKKPLKNLVFIPKTTPEKVPQYLKAFDILLLPTPKYSRHFSHYTSHLKLFEYLASGKPIIASNLPAIKQIVSHQQTALIVNPCKDSFIKAINLVISQPDLKKSLAKASKKLAYQYTWDNRASQILKSI